MKKQREPRTLTERVVRYLVLGRCLTERAGRSGRYRWFTDSEGNNYFVGKAGAVRTGTSVSNSRSITDSVHAMMKLWEIKRK